MLFAAYKPGQIIQDFFLHFFQNVWDPTSNTVALYSPEFTAIFSTMPWVLTPLTCFPFYANFNESYHGESHSHKDSYYWCCVVQWNVNFSISCVCTWKFSIQPVYENIHGDCWTGELFTKAAEAATEAMKGRLANKYYMLAEEAWAEVDDDE